jgi:muramoyltetrapeptide carboxypeptidase LdcA involved in peptidoglycan recycling
MPPLENSILFIEDDYESKAENFDRDLQSLMHQSGFSQVKAIIIGRFQSASEVTKEKLEFIIKTKQDLEKIPVIANVDFGHTLPRIAFPIGGIAIVDTTTKDAQIIIKEH